MTSGACVTSRDPQQRRLHLLFSLNRAEIEYGGGPSVRVRDTAEALRALGHDVVISFGEEMPSSHFDLAHAFNSWPEDASLSRLERLASSGVPVVFSPIFMEYRELHWALPLVKKAFGPRPFANRDFARFLPPWTRLRMLRTLRRTRPDRRRTIPASAEAYYDKVGRMIGMAHHVVLLSYCELQALRRIGAEPESWSVVRNSTDPSRFEHADPALFRKTYDLADYVVCVGRIEHRKNQVMLMEALRNTGLGLALVGTALDGEYDELVRAATWPGVRRVDSLENGGPLLASAYAGASAFVLPSWAEGAPVSALEAAACGCPLVLSNRSGEREYFGALAEYCDPSDPASIRDAVSRAIANDSRERRMRRRALVTGKLGFAVTARALLSSYWKTLERSSREMAE